MRGYIFKKDPFIRQGAIDENHLVIDMGNPPPVVGQALDLHFNRLPGKYCLVPSLSCHIGYIPGERYVCIPA